MCSDQHAEDIPLVLPKTQLPPNRSDLSKQSNGIARSCNVFTTAIPDEPAPITHTRGRPDPPIPRTYKRMTGASSFCPAAVLSRRRPPQPDATPSARRDPVRALVLGLHAPCRLAATMLTAALDHLTEAPETEDQHQRAEAQRRAQDRGGDLLADRERGHVGVAGGDRQQQRQI